MKSKFILLLFALNWLVCLNLNGANKSPTEMKFDSLRIKVHELINTPEEII